MRRLWAPWRLQYLVNHEGDGCIFCEKPKQLRDRHNHIVLRGETCYVMLNAFPYNNGHVLIVPYRHVGALGEMTTKEKLEFMELADEVIAALRHTMHPEGFNLGINQGKAAGAGIADHIHLHVVPRWTGDYNFMPLLSDTKIIPETLDQTFDKLRAQLDTRGGHED